MSIKRILLCAVLTGGMTGIFVGMILSVVLLPLHTSPLYFVFITAGIVMPVIIIFVVLYIKYINPCAVYTALSGAVLTAAGTAYRIKKRISEKKTQD